MALRKKIRFHNDKIVVPANPRVKVLLEAEKGDLIPHTIETTRLLRNLGYAVPAPIMRQYEWPTDQPPFHTQKITSALLTMNPRAYVLSEMGTGKTRSALYACDHLIKTGVIKKVLVVAPLSTLSPVWDYEIYRYFNQYSTGVVHGTRKKRQKVLAEEHDFYVINHDGLGVVMAELMAMDFDCIIIDEAGAFRNKSTERWKKMNRLVQRARYVWAMTGSPTPNEPTDAWGLSKLITPKLPPKYFKEFQRQTMTQITQFKWIAKPDANDKVYEILQPAVRYKRDDCIELPETVYKTLDIPPSAQVEKTYKKMMAALRIAFEEGKISAANEGVLFQKLLQISCGWCYTNEKGIVKLDNKARLDAVYEAIMEADSKSIVFANFRHAAEGVYQRLLDTKFKPGFAELITGGVNKTNRDRIFKDFQNEAWPRVIIAHPQTMSHGLTLTEANTIIWYTPTTSLETYEQANARITRPGQKKKSMVMHLQSTQIERRLYSRLQKKASMQGALLDLFADN